MVKGLELLEELKNSAEIKKENGKIVLVFDKEIKISESEKVKKFNFTVPTLLDIEVALEATKDEESEEIKQLKQSYYLISSQFSPKMPPDEINDILTINEMRIFSEVIEPFLS